MQPDERKLGHMDFDTLNAMIPYAKGGKEKALRMSPYPLITLAMPGRHWDQTTPRGGDFVVMVTDPGRGWTDHQFKHDDIFEDLQARRDISQESADELVQQYFEVVVLGHDPDHFADHWLGPRYIDGLDSLVHPLSFLQATQCLAVAEHRRYAKFEGQGGGRYLPLRFAAGIAAGEWNYADAKIMQKRGRPGVEQLEKEMGVPKITQELLKCLKET